MNKDRLYELNQLSKKIEILEKTIEKVNGRDHMDFCFGLVYKNPVTFDKSVYYDFRDKKITEQVMEILKNRLNEYRDEFNKG